MRLLLIRHAATRGNLERRYVGATDEDICDRGRRALQGREWPQAELVATSPMRRCVQTAQILYPGHAPVIVPDFREIDFGEFEYRTADELKDSKAYRAWIDSDATLPFPGGESREAFSARCVAAFAEFMRANGRAASIAIVAHGGTLMSILERFATPARAYFDWHLPNGACYDCAWDGGRISEVKRI